MNNTNKNPSTFVNGFSFGTPSRNRTCNCPLGGGCYIHLTMQAHKKPSAENDERFQLLYFNCFLLVCQGLHACFFNYFYIVGVNSAFEIYNFFYLCNLIYGETFAFHNYIYVITAYNSNAI